MLIPRRYQQLVGITQEVRFLGVGDTIEIWAGGKDSKPFMDAEDFGKALEELMGEEQLKPLTTQPLSRPSDTLSP
jgi:MraZ protein